MLELICGEAGTGKSRLLYKRINEAAKAGKRVYLFVPDQFSFEAEKLIYKTVPHRLSEQVSVTFFSKAAQKILHLYGETKEYADDIVKNMLMLRALNEKASEGALTYYGSQIKKQGFTSFALRAVGEIRNAGLSPSAFRSAVSAGDFPEILMKKLNDLCEIYSAYDTLLTAGFDDRLDDVRRAAELIEQSDIFDGALCFFDNFDSFSGSQLVFIKALLRRCESVTLALTTDSPDSRDKRFLSAAHLIGKLKEMADGEYNVTLLREKYRSPSLTAVEAADPWQECDWICSEIRRLMDEGVRCRDIAVLTPEAKYARILDSSLKKYEIPAFSDIPEPIISKDIVRFSLYALRALSFETEDILRYVKSGFVRHENGKIISNIQADSLEKLCRRYDLRKKDWTKAFPEKLDKTGEYEALRKSIIEPLLLLKKQTENTDGAEITRAVCDFLCNTMDINRTIYGKCIIETGENGKKVVDSRKMEGYSSLWDDTLTVFESAYKALSGYNMTVKEYINIMTSVFTSVTIAKPPQVLDAVTVGDTERSRFTAVKNLFLCGFNQGVMPRPAAVSEVFTSAETEQLVRCGIPVCENRNSRYSHELFMLYRCVSLPEERLYITYPLQSDSFSSLEPSQYLGEICESFKADIIRAEDFDAGFYCRTEKAAERYLAAIYSEGGRTAEKKALKKILPKNFGDMLKAAAEKNDNPERHRITREQAASLLSMNSYSPSAFESLNGCKFRYFCRYGLELKEDEIRDITPALVGNVIHFCLQRLLFDYVDRRDEFLKLSKEDIAKNIGESTEIYQQEHYFSDFGGAERFRYMVKRLGDYALLAALNIQRELKESGFYPVEFEKKLTFTLGDYTISGLCDRIDTLEKEGKKYIRVVDYKRGYKDIALEEIYRGEKLQMLLYLFGLCENGALPSSVMYLPVGKSGYKEASGGDIESEAKSSMGSYIKKHARCGIVLESSPETEDIENYDRALSEEYGKKRGGYMSVTKISDEAYESIRKYCCAYVNAKIKESLMGMAGACPADESACAYCEYGLFCGKEKI